MKSITFIILLLATTLFGQTDSTFSITINGAIPSLFEYDCEKWETTSDWGVENIGHSNDLCSHVWVFADYKDVNKISNYTTLQYCPCGCGGHIIEARICELCLRHEKRVKTYGYSQVKYKSGYMKLLEKLAQRD